MGRKSFTTPALVVKLTTNMFEADARVHLPLQLPFICVLPIAVKVLGVHAVASEAALEFLVCLSSREESQKVCQYVLSWRFLRQGLFAVDDTLAAAATYICFALRIGCPSRRAKPRSWTRFAA